MTSRWPVSSYLLQCLLAFFLCMPSFSEMAAEVPSSSAFLVLDPMIGHTDSRSTRIWCKASSAARMSVRVGEQEDLSDGREVPGPDLEAGNGFMGHVVVSTLQPDRGYFYCVLLNGIPAMLRPYPSLKTAPPEGQGGRVRFAFTSCVGYHGFDSAAGFADMMRTNFDLLLMLGDNHYANTNEVTRQREFFQDQRSTPGYRALARHVPIYAIWDDHDFGPDNSDGSLLGKERALQTFQEHWANPSYGELDNPGVYFKLSRCEVDFFFLDGRYYRSPNKATNSPTKTMLGEKQLSWLKREVKNSHAKIKVLISGGEWQLHGTEDSWTSFAREREEIFQFLEQNQVRGVLLLSGDRHFTAAYQVKGQWIEVTVGPIGSSNAKQKNLPEMFLNFSDRPDNKDKFYCIYDIDTRPEPPMVVLEVYKAAEGLAHRRVFTWDEVLGHQKIELLPSPPAVTPRGNSAARSSDSRKDVGHQ